MPILVVVILTGSFLVLACGNPQWNRWIFAFQAYVLKKTVSDIPADYSGTWQSWYPNGQLGESREYKNGKRHGVWLRFRQDGQIEFECEYAAGLEHGRYAKWYENGIKYVEGGYADGKQHGKWTVWDADGAVISVTHFDNGRKVPKP